MQQLVERKEEANNYFKDGDHVTASQLYERILQDLNDIDEDDQNSLRKAVLNNYSSCCIQLNRFDAAIAAATDCLRLDTGNTKALYRRSVAYKNKQELGLALSDCDCLIKLDGRNRQAKSLQAELMLLRQKEMLSNSSDEEKESQIVPIIERVKSSIEQANDEYRYSFMNPEWPCTMGSASSSVSCNPESELTTAWRPAKKISILGLTSLNAKVKEVKQQKKLAVVCEPVSTETQLEALHAIDELSEIEKAEMEKFAQTVAARKLKAAEKKSKRELKTAFRAKKDVNDITASLKAVKITNSSTLDAWQQMMAEETQQLTTFKEKTAKAKISR